MLLYDYCDYICTLFVPLRQDKASRYKNSGIALFILHLIALNNVKSYLMSSNFKIQKICQHCGNEFQAQKTTTKFCSHRCASRAYKQNLTTLKIELSNKEADRIKTKPIEELKAKEFLKVREVAQLLNCSIRSVYCYIDCGKLKAVNLSQRVTRIKRSEIDKLFA